MPVRRNQSTRSLATERLEALKTMDRLQLEIKWKILEWLEQGYSLAGTSIDIYIDTNTAKHNFASVHIYNDSYDNEEDEY